MLEKGSQACSVNYTLSNVPGVLASRSYSEMSNSGLIIMTRKIAHIFLITSLSF